MFDLPLYRNGNAIHNEEISSLLRIFAHRKNDVGR